MDDDEFADEDFLSAIDSICAKHQNGGSNLGATNMGSGPPPQVHAPANVQGVTWAPVQAPGPAWQGKAAGQHAPAPQPNLGHARMPVTPGLHAQPAWQQGQHQPYQQAAGPPQQQTGPWRPHPQPARAAFSGPSPPTAQLPTANAAGPSMHGPILLPPAAPQVPIAVAPPFATAAQPHAPPHALPQMPTGAVAGAAPPAQHGALPSTHPQSMQGMQGPMQGMQGPMQGVQGPMQSVQVPMQGVQGPMQGVQGPVQGVQTPMQAAASIQHAQVMPPASSHAATQHAAPTLPAQPAAPPATAQAGGQTGVPTILLQSPQPINAAAVQPIINTAVPPHAPTTSQGLGLPANGPPLLHAPPAGPQVSGGGANGLPPTAVAPAAAPGSGRAINGPQPALPPAAAPGAGAAASGPHSAVLPLAAGPGSGQATNGMRGGATRPGLGRGGSGNRPTRQFMQVGSSSDLMERAQEPANPQHQGPASAPGGPGQRGPQQQPWQGQGQQQQHQNQQQPEWQGQGPQQGQLQGQQQQAWQGQQPGQQQGQQQGQQGMQRQPHDRASGTSMRQGAMPQPLQPSHAGGGPPGATSGGPHSGNSSGPPPHHAGPPAHNGGPPAHNGGPPSNHSSGLPAQQGTAANPFQSFSHNPVHGTGRPPLGHPSGAQLGNPAPGAQSGHASGAQSGHAQSGPQSGSSGPAGPSLHALLGCGQQQPAGRPSGHSVGSGGQQQSGGHTSSAGAQALSRAVSGSGSGGRPLVQPAAVLVALSLEAGGLMGLKCTPAATPDMEVLLRAVVGGSFEASKRLWLVPLRAFPRLRVGLEGLRSSKLRWEGEPQAVVRDITQASSLLQDDSHRYERLHRTLDAAGESLDTRMMQFQREGVQFALKHGGRVLIGDEMGLGKTVQGCALLKCYEDEWPALVVTPSSLRQQWADAAKKWIGMDEMDILVVFGKQDAAKVIAMHKKRLGNKRCALGFSLLVVSYDWVHKLQDELLGLNLNCVMLDEAHYIKTQNTQRSKASVALLQQAKRATLLTGTPALSRPIELLTLMQGVLPSAKIKFHDFTDRYCIPNKFCKTGGSRNSEELNRLITGTFMIRRKKCDVLKQLPSKTRQQVYLPVDDKAQTALKKQQEELDKVRELVSKASKGPSGGLMAGLQQEQQQAIMRLYHQTAKLKVPAVQEYVKDVLANDVKFLVFAHHHDLLDGIEKAVNEAKAGYIRIDGKTDARVRDSLRAKFQEDENVKVAILGITAAGVGLTLTAASTVLFAELSWVPGEIMQAEDRVHRIGQESAVNIQFLLVRKSIDDIMWETLQSKLSDIGKVLDGKQDSLHVVAKCEAGAGAASHGPSHGTLEAYFQPLGPPPHGQPPQGQPPRGPLDGFFQPAGREGGASGSGQGGSGSGAAGAGSGRGTGGAGAVGSGRSGGQQDADVGRGSGVGGEGSGRGQGGRGGGGKGGNGEDGGAAAGARGGRGRGGVGAGAAAAGAGGGGRRDALPAASLKRIRDWDDDDDDDDDDVQVIE